MPSLVASSRNSTGDQTLTLEELQGLTWSGCRRAMTCLSGNEPLAVRATNVRRLLERAREQGLDWKPIYQSLAERYPKLATLMRPRP